MVKIPALLELMLRAVPQILDGIVFPLVLFLVVMELANVWFAIIAGMGWSIFAITRRLIAGKQVPGFMIVGSLMLLARSCLALATGSTFVYFAQPILGTLIVAAAFLLSVAIGKPLARRFAGDYCDIPRHVHEDDRVHSYFQRCSMMWAVVGLLNTGITLWLLLSTPTGMYVIFKTFLSIGMTVGAVGVSIIWFRRTVHRHDLMGVAPVAV